MALISPFQLPNELRISSLCAQYPCREPQIRSLETLLSRCSKPPKNIVLYGLEATGKSSIAASLLSAFRSTSYVEDPKGGHSTGPQLLYAIVKSAESITGRHLLETALAAIAEAVGWEGTVSRCENLAQLLVEAGRLVDGNVGKEYVTREAHRSRNKFVLVFDGIDEQRDPPSTLLPALARMGEIIPGLITIFIVKSPRPYFLYIPGVPHIHFPAYSKSEALQILSLQVPPISARSTLRPESELDPKAAKELKDFWIRFCSAVWDTLSKHSGRDILSFRSTCNRLWPFFTAPIRDGTYTLKDFGRLFVSKRSLFQDERVLVPSIVPFLPPSTAQSTLPSTTDPKTRTDPNIATQLPLYSRLLLIASYLASYTPARNDALLFMKAASKARRKKGGGTAKGRPQTFKHRKISRKLLGPQAFVMERMLAIFHAVRTDASGVGVWSATADMPMAIATLASLRLVIKTSPSADPLDGGSKWKVNVSWEVVRSVARSMGIEVEDFLLE